MSSSNRVFGLDCIRATAILLVLFAHSIEYLDFLPFAVRNNFLYLFGSLGVELFFVLSGFLVGGIALNILETHGKISLRDAALFLKNRWFRTLPNYFLALLVATIVSPSFTLDEFWSWKYFFFLQSVSDAHPHFFSHAWSLCVEEWFYLLLIVLLALGSAASTYNPKTNGKLIITALILGGLVVRMVGVILFRPPWDEVIRKAVLYRADAIVYGVFFAYLKLYHNRWFVAQARVLYRVGLIGLMTLVLLFGKDFFSNQSGIFYDIAFLPLLDICLACLLPLAFLYNKEIRWRRTSMIVTHLSVISYSLYLYHPIVHQLINISVDSRDVSYLNISGFVLFWLMSYLVATVVYRFYERPMTTLRGY